MIYLADFTEVKRCVPVYLEIYRKEAYMDHLPFKIEDKGKHELKGYEEPIPVFSVYRNEPL